MSWKRCSCHPKRNEDMNRSLQHPPRLGPWRRGSSRRDRMNLIPPSGKLSFDAPWTKAESSTWSTTAPRRSPWTRWRSTTSVISRSRSATKVGLQRLFFLFWNIQFNSTSTLFVALKDLQMRVLVPPMTKTCLKKTSQTPQSPSLRIPPMVQGWTFRSWTLCLWLLTNLPVASLLLDQAPARLLTSCGLPWAPSAPCSPPAARRPTRAGPRRSRWRSGPRRSLWTWTCSRQPHWRTTWCSPLFLYLTPCLPRRRPGSAPFRVSRPTRHGHAPISPEQAPVQSVLYACWGGKSFSLHNTEVLLKTFL